MIRDDTWWYVMIRQIWDHTMKGASVDSQKWRAVMELLSLPRRSMTSPFAGERFHRSIFHRESWVLSHQSSKMGVSFIWICQYCCYCRCGNSELFRMTTCPPIVFSSPELKWAFSDLLLFVVCPSVCKCFWLKLLNHSPWHKVSLIWVKRRKFVQIKGNNRSPKGRKNEVVHKIFCRHSIIYWFNFHQTRYEAYLGQMAVYSMKGQTFRRGAAWIITKMIAF